MLYNKLLFLKGCYMITPTKEYKNLITHRLEENWKSFKLLFDIKHYGNCISLMCQELDQYITVLFLLKQNMERRNHLISLSINSQKWYIVGSDNKKEYITDDVLLKFTDSLTGWERSIYEIGFIFKHLTVNSNYVLKNPILSLDHIERKQIRDYIFEYHTTELPEEYKIEELVPILPLVFERISDNIKIYIVNL
jgi:hypothetical protein